MCGISGKIFFSGDRMVDPALIEKMSAVMAHRGPDDYGSYIFRNVGLGHRRLSIIDLQTGKQPLSNENGKVWVVFNGEIYNYRQLREELIEKGHRFKTRTDTEVIAHLYEEYGEASISKLQGMFAIALWDETDRILLLARDRVGIKPLYYHLSEDCLTFGSEMKAILADNAISRDIDPNGLGLLLGYYYMPGEATLLYGIKKLLPGHYLLVKDGKCQYKQYWDFSFVKKDGHARFEVSRQELLGLLRKSVRDHMISDVPVGFLLSGGVDSTALLSFAVEETDKEISTFTIGFESGQFEDERKYAALAAKKFGTKHYDMTIDENEFVSFLPRYVWHMEEPVCEPPAVALYYVSKLARGHVKVLLSGEGGDEAFAGYPNYRNIVWLERIKKLSGPLSPALGSAASLFAAAGHFRRLGKYSPLFSADFRDYYYSRTSSPFTYFNKNSRDLLTPAFQGGIDENHSFRKLLLEKADGFEFLDKMLYIDSKTWLPDDLLVKADKITMANSVELRVPFLDHAVLEFAASLPDGFKLKRFTTKYILKRAFEGRVPEAILNRKKTGFPVPYERWISKKLSGFVNDLLLDARTINRGYFRKAGIAKMLEANNQRMAYSKEIFILVVLELWNRCFIDQPSPVDH